MPPETREQLRAGEDEQALTPGAGLTGRRFQRRPRALARLAEPRLPIDEGEPRRQIVRRDRVYRTALACADGLSTALALAAVLALAGSTGSVPAALIAVPMLIAMNKVAGLYDRDELVINKSTLDEAPALVQIAGLFALLFWILHQQVTAVVLGPVDVMALWAVGVVLLLGGRAAARRFARRVTPAERCLLIGDPAAVRSVARKLRSARSGAEVVGTVPLAPGASGEASPDARDGDFGLLVRQYDVHRVIVAPTSTDAADTLDLIRTAKSAGVSVSVLPRLFEAVGSAVEFDHLEGLTMLGVRRFGLKRSSLVVKRAFDLGGASAAILLFSPVMALIALAIRLDSSGPSLFAQVRVGRDGRRFRMLKFRSMVVDAEARKRDLVHLNETEGLFKIQDDPRITAVGRFIRSTSLDELPQLFNVWRGEMSLVGPRPLVVDEDARVHGVFRSRLHLTPGMTGHWQVLGSARIPMDEMVGIDYLYIANWSLWLDVKILLRTIPHVIARGGM